MRDVRVFYGLASYYRRFVEDFAKIAEPLSRLTRKHNTFNWTDETSTLEYPGPDISCILDTDASDVAVGGALSQVTDGKERPIAFVSKMLNGPQKNYCPTRRELWGSGP